MDLGCFSFFVSGLILLVCFFVVNCVLSFVLVRVA